MSFILDALKKSESERQRQTVPGLMDTRMARRRNRLPPWALALGVLLGINLLVLTWVLWRKSAPAQTPPAVVSAPARTDAPAPPVAQHFSPLDAAPVYAPEIPVAAADSPAAPRSSMSTGPMDPGSTMDRAGAAGPARAAVRSAHHADPLLTAEDGKTDSEEVLPSISEVSLSGAHALPELHLDVHVYATNPAERFVYINMRKYHEGSPLQEGPLVERIRRDGVVLNYQGLRFLLPRQP